MMVTRREGSPGVTADIFDKAMAVDKPQGPAPKMTMFLMDIVLSQSRLLSSKYYVTGLVALLQR